ncbi:ACP phosphodiesterase [Vibrio renipiscarius]|uniref:ACP phosphodiesterase n=1 Tax=Vibrio renipiscarius TaxID=1461322 RepID=A0A0C2NPC7_9VIBR|nr:ACP phosphodiesterase [Vibrio renipiscarius]KII75952.1 ACP phosphodiesterase [Vibrio renipiscarius]KII79056.1 ACP phosphodiesterase [Vibrio renipiscarius]
MNFLAHLHIAHHCDSSLLGNLLGDFVRGDPSKVYSPELTRGIRLHRFVDSYTDSAEIITSAKQLFPQGPRRFSGIALDVFWDHCLASHWSDYHDLPLANFCLQSEMTIKQTPSGELPERFLLVSDNMWRGRWLESYQDVDNIEIALTRMSQRRATMAPIKTCFPYLERHYDELQQIFSAFYPALLRSSQDFSGES